MGVPWSAPPARSRPISFNRPRFRPAVERAGVEGARTEILGRARQKSEPTQKGLTEEFNEGPVYRGIVRVK